MKNILFTFFGILLSATSYSQGKASIKGMLVDSEKRSKVSYATVSVYNAIDSSLVNYKLSDPNGNFIIPSLPAGKYQLVIVAWQYNKFLKDVEISGDRTIDMDTITLSQRSNELQEVTLLGDRPPIVVRNDTVEFNAESFKLLPVAVVEDLLKKLPGIIINANGEIIYNGRIVSRILVDGKEFFGSDTQIASKNLPANIVDKVQIMDDRDIKRRNPDLRTQDIPQVINLTLRKAIKQGAFGKVYAGAGLKDFYEAGGILNVFRDTTQVSILGFTNNISKSAFSLSDVKRIGGFERGGYNSLRTEDSGYSIDNVSFGGTGNGIQRIFGGGLNLNTEFKDGIKVNGKYFFGQNNTLIQQLNNDNQVLAARTLNTSSNIQNKNSINSHNFGARIEINPSPNLELQIVPSIEITPRSFFNTNHKITNDPIQSNVSESDFSNTRDGLLTAYRLNANLYKDFKKKGRRLFVGTSLASVKNDEDNINYSSSFFSASNNSTILDQLRDNSVKNSGIQANAVFSEPLTKTFKISADISGNFFNNENFLNTFYKNPLNQEYDIVIPTMSETVVQKGLKTTSTARLSWNINKNLIVQPSLIFGTINIQNKFDKYSDFNQKFTFLNPGANIRYKSFSIDYQRAFQEPSVQYVQPVANNTDPFFVQFGNAELLPSVTNRVFVFYNKFDMKKAINYGFNLNASNEDNGIIMSRTIDANGVQTSKPINANGIRQISNGGNISKSIKNKANQLTFNLGYTASIFNTPIEINNKRTSTTRFFITPTAGIRINLNDKIELFENYYVSISKSRYQDDFYSNLSASTHVSDSELIYRFHKKFVFESNLKLQLTDQQLEGYKSTVKILNAGFTYVFTKRDLAQLKFSINDILQNNVKRFSTISENLLRNTQINNIGRYGLITLTYNIRDYKQKVGGKERFLNF